jgi:hypothetical protein
VDERKPKPMQEYLQGKALMAGNRQRGEGEWFDA